MSFDDMQFMGRRLLSITLLVLAAAGIPAQAQKPKPTPRPTPRLTIIGSADEMTVRAPVSADIERRQDAFLKAWRTLNDHYFDKTFNGLDWNKVRQEYLPRVNAARSDAEVHRLIEEMVGKLDKSHFGLIPPEYFASLRAAQEKAREREKQAAAADGPPATPDDEKKETPDLTARYGIGVELRFIDNSFVITSVEKRSGAAIAGLKPGYIVQKINGVALSDLTSRLLAAYPDVRHLQRYLPTQLVALFLNGERDTSVLLTCLDENDELRDFKVSRLTLGGQNVSIGQRFPSQFLQFRTASLSYDIGYVKFNIFGLPVIGKFCDALSEFSAKKAIVVDLRGNIGGLLGTLVGLSGMLTDRPLTIGTSLYRYRSEVVSVTPKAKNFKGKIVFLVDSQTMSAAELFAAGLQESGRVLIVGERTAGEALPAGSVELATGAILIYPVANFRTSKGKYIEGSGVDPNFTVALNRKSLLKGEDAQLDKAISLIKEDRAFPAAAGSADTEPLPPPPVARKATLSQGSGRGSGLTAPRPSEAKPAKDPIALKLISNFAAAIGGADSVKKMATYEADGTAGLSNAGSDTTVQYHVYREQPDKYSVIMISPVIGEVREVHNGKDVFVQSDYGIDADTIGFDAATTHLFSPLTTLSNPDLFRTLSYLGEYDDHGQKLKLVQGVVGPGITVAMAFDSRTNLLVRCSMASFSYTLGDYRKVGTLTLPFAIKIEGAIDIKLDTITLEPKIDPSNFQKKDKCFDKPL